MVVREWRTHAIVRQSLCEQACNWHTHGVPIVRGGSSRRWKAFRRAGSLSRGPTDRSWRCGPAAGAIRAGSGLDLTLAHALHTMRLRELQTLESAEPW